VFNGIKSTTGKVFGFNGRDLVHAKNCGIIYQTIEGFLGYLDLYRRVDF